MIVSKLLAILVPVAFVLAIVLVGRRRPVVFLTVPLIPFMGRAIYLDTVQYGFSVMGSPALGIAEITAILTAVTCLVVRRHRPSAVRLMRLAPETGVSAALICWIGLGVVASLAAGYRMPEAVRMAATFTYPLAGYFLWLDILRRFSREEIMMFVRFLALSSAPLMILYCLQEIGYKTYPFAPNATYAGGLARDFETLTPFVFLAFGYLLAWPVRRVWWGLATACAVMALLLTYTRWMVVAAAVCLGLAVLAQMVGQRSIGSRISATLGVIVVVIGSAATVLALSPAAWDLLTARLSTVPQIPSDANALSRASSWMTALDTMRARGDLALGAGFLPPFRWAEYGLTAVTHGQMGDVMWPSVLITMGIVGVVGFAVLLVVALARAAWMAFAGSRVRRATGLFLLVTLVFLGASTFGSGGLLTIGTVAGLYLALLTVLYDGAWDTIPRHVATTDPRDSLAA